MKLPVHPREPTPDVLANVMAGCFLVVVIVVVVVIVSFVITVCVGVW